jgi:hypothetical protein
MKKLHLVLLLVVTLTTAKAQIEKKTVYLGATSNLSLLGVTTGPNSSSTTYFNISPQVGYFFADNFLLGADLSFSSNAGINQTTIGVFTRYYIKGKVFLGGGYSSSSFSGGNSFGLFNLEGGYAAFITPNIAVEPALVFSKGTGDATNYTTFGLQVGFSLYFNRKKVE